MARPIPLEAPVTMAVFPAKGFESDIVWVPVERIDMIK